MTTDPTPSPDPQLAELLNRVSSAVWTLENSVGFLEAARDDQLPDGYFCIEGIETLKFKTARNSANEAHEALEELEVKYGLQGEIGVVR